MIIVIFIVLTVGGLFSYSKLGYELIPKFSMPFVIVNTIYPGASPAEVENSVTKVIEEAVSNMENVKSIRGTSVESLSFILIELRDGTDVDIALQQAQRNINARQRELPEQADPPSLTKFATDEFPILSIGATAALDPTEFYDLVIDRIKPAISSIPGVGEVRVIGGQEREIQVNVSRKKLEARGISILQVVQAIKAANLDFPTGKIESETAQVIIRLSGKLSSVEEMKGLTVANNPMTGLPVKLGEIADVTDGKKSPTTLSRTNGVSGFGLQILKSTDANAVAVAEGVLGKLEELKEQSADSNLDFVVASNQTDFTLEAVDAVSHDLLMAIVLVAVVMLFFLHSIRNALIVMLAIPTSLVATLIMMYAFGFTLNLMTLLAMSLVIGILVDDSIVVLENIHRHLEMGMDQRKAALLGRNEIAFTALSITLVDVVVFVPIALSAGIVGKIMGQFALVVTFSTLMSLFVSFTLTPMLASRFSKLEVYKKGSIGGLLFNGFERFLNKINDWYARQVNRILRPIKIGNFNFYLNGLLVLVIAFVLFISSFLLVAKGYIGTSFMKHGDRGQFILLLELPKDATIKEMNLATRKAEKYLLQQQPITSVFTTVGLTTNMLGNQEKLYKSELTIKLVPKDQRDFHTSHYAQDLRNEMEKILPGVKVTSSEVSFLGGADSDPIMLFLSGPDKKQVMGYANKLLAELKKIPGTLEARLSIEEGTPEVQVSVDRERMAQLGLSMDMVGATMQTAFNGNTDAQFRTGGKEYDINIKLDGFDRKSIDDIANLPVMNGKGQLIKMSQFASIVQTTGPNQLERRNRQASVTLLSKVLGRTSGDVGADLIALMDKKLPPPKGISVAYDGDLKNQQDGFGSLGLAFMASILFVYLIMVALYDSWIYPLVVLFSIPMAIIGAFLAMALTLSILDIFSILGIIMLVGLVAKNAILLVDFTNQAKAEGKSTHDALVEAGRTRLRPILMTTLSMAIGFLPIALANGAGSEWKNGLAWALIGGLLSSMILTLIVVPVVYLFMDGLKVKAMRLFGM